jgi:hypothetical protein
VGLIDLRPSLGPVLDQGSRPTCVAFALTAAHEFTRSEGVPLSPEFIYWSAKQRDGLGIRAPGTTVHAAIEGLGNNGQPPESLWPYDPSRNVIATVYKPSKQALSEAKQRCVFGFSSVAPSSTEIMRCLVDGTACVLVLTLFSTWYMLGPKSEVPMPGPNDISLGLHAVLVVGNAVSGHRQALVIRNSWGVSWGRGGYAYVLHDYVDAYTREAWRLPKRTSPSP